MEEYSKLQIIRGKEPEPERRIGSDSACGGRHARPAFRDMAGMDRRMENTPCRGTVYTVKEGDTLYLISRKFRVPLAFILKANPMVDIYNLQIGQQICVPRVGTNLPRPDGSCPSCGFITYVVKAGESLQDILDFLGIELEDLLKYNNNGTLYLKEGMEIRVPQNESGNEA